MLKFKVKRIGGHWYPDIKHELGYINSFCNKIDRFFTLLNNSNSEELTLEFEELGVIFGGVNIIYFNESDIIRYLTTDDDFNLHFVINDYEFEIDSNFYWQLEYLFNFNFHKTSYKIHIY